MHEKVIRQIRFEIEQIEQLFESYAKLLEKAQQRKPDLVEITAIASVLHSFYNGLENIFLCIAKGIDGDVPEGGQWHRNLLTRMTETTPKRKAVLTSATSDQLGTYMGFRHFYRHSYSFFLDWPRLDVLVIPLKAVWKQAKGEIQLFTDQIEA